jgi:hypothetical protein
MTETINKSIIIPFTGFYESPWVPNLVNCRDYPKWTQKFCKAYVEQFNTLLKDEGVDLGLEFESVDSPKFYNFETDRIFATIEHPERLDPTQSSLDKVARERHTSREGFISYYNPDWRDWGLQSTWDHNQLQTALLAVMEDLGIPTGFDLESMLVEDGDLYELADQYEQEEDDDEG